MAFGSSPALARRTLRCVTVLRWIGAAATRPRSAVADVCHETFPREDCVGRVRGFNEEADFDLIRFIMEVDGEPGDAPPGDAEGDRQGAMTDQLAPICT